MQRLVGFLCLFVAGVALGGEGSRPEGRLPATVVPSRYDLSLTIVPEREGFTGSVAIDVEVREPVSVIWLHGNGLEVDRSRLRLADGTELDAEYEQVNETGLVQLTLPREIEPQSASLEFAWSAVYSDDLDGLYRVVEDDRSYVFTQFEPIAARKVFPGFDEPAFKTPFDIELTVDADHAAITATPETSRRELGNGRVRITYGTTRPLPTYLIAFAVGPLDVVAAEPVPANDARDRELPLRGVAVKGKGEQLAYALERTGDLLQALERYTGIGYPYAKLDIIAVPDFQAGAMENVGAITFREYLLLLDESSSSAQKRSFASVMAHELAHFWFGNLVTTPWWDDIWLNEAFATWFAAKGVEAVYPEHRPQARLFDRVLRVMEADSLVSARRIRQPITSSDDIYNAFDGITYRKGAAVLGMFERFVGGEKFRLAVHYYLRDHEHGNGNYRDFLGAVSGAAGRDDVVPAFESFLDQSGVPLIEVSQSCGGDSAAMTLRQSRYLPLGSRGERERTWQVPVCLRYGSDSQQRERCVLLDEAEATLELDFCPDWVVPNAGGAGYFRWHAGEGIEVPVPGEPAGDAGRVREQMAWADSLKASVRAGRTPVAEALDALTPILGWTDPLLAEAPVPLFRLATDQLPANEAEREAARSRLARPLVPVLLAANLLPSKRPETGELRNLWLTLMARDARMGVMLESSLNRALRWLEGEADAVDPDLLDAILKAAVIRGGAGFHERLVGRLEGDLTAAERASLIGALGYTLDEHAIERTRELIFTDVLRSSDIEDLLIGQATLPETRAGNWQWVRDNFDRLVEVIPAWQAGELPELAKGFCSEERAAEVESFFEPRIGKLQGGPRELAQALEAIRVCAAMSAHQRQSFLDWLDLHGSDSEQGD